MKHKYKIRVSALVMAFVLCFFTACSGAPAQAQAEELAIKSISAAQYRKPGKLYAPITENDLSGGSIGVYVVSPTGDSYRAENVKWTYNNGVWELDDTTKVLFENNGEKQQIAAYYPYTAEATNNELQITLPEKYDAEYENYDYLYSGFHPLSSNPATIRLNHLMSKVTVTVQSIGTELDGDEVASIALVGVPRTVTWTLPNAELSGYGDHESIELYNNEGAYTGYALPNGSIDIALRITMASGRVFNATASLDDITTYWTETLESGVHYNLGVKVGKDKVVITGVNVTPWAEKDIDGGVAEEIQN